jgi:hypothetical protein
MPFTTKVNTSDLGHKALWQLLADTDHGVNPRLSAALSDAGITPPPSFRLPFDFSDNSLNVFPVDVEPNIQGKTSFAQTYPMMTVFNGPAVDQRLEKFYSFAGEIICGINIYFSLATTSVPRKLGAIVDVFQNVLFSTVSDVRFGTWSTQYDHRLVFGGRMSCSRTPPVTGAESWFQSLQATVPMQVHSA